MPRFRPNLDEIRQDVRFAARTSLASTGFAVAAVMLGLAIGSATSVLATADWLLDRSPGGVVAPERVVALSLTEAGRHDIDGRYGFSFPQYEALREVQDAFSETAAYAKVVRPAGHGDWTEEVVYQFVTGSYFPLLGVRPHLGRLIGPEDDRDGEVAHALISHAFWRSHFGGDPDVVGRTMTFALDPVRIVGVLPPDFVDYTLDWNGPTQVWLPMRSARSLQGMSAILTMQTTFFPILGRLKPGVTAAQAREMTKRWMPKLPAIRMSLFEPNAIAVQPERTWRIARRDAASSFLGSLFAVCVIVLLAACANVVDHHLGRCILRRREISIRAALGAGRARIARQLATECVLLGVATAGVATVVSVGVARAMATLPGLYLGIPERAAPVTTAAAIDLRLAVASLAFGFAVPVGLGFVSTLGVVRDPARWIQRESPGWGWGRWRPTARQMVLVLQVGLGVALAAAAALLGRSFQRAVETDPELGDPGTLLFARLVPLGLERPEAAVMLNAILDEVRGSPGVEAASMSANPPWTGGQTTAHRADGAGPRVEVGYATAGSGHFRTSGVEVLAGGEFGDAADPGEAIVNARLAERLWPGEDPIGRALVVGEGEVRVRAVVARERCRTLTGPPAECVWAPHAFVGSSTIRVRTRVPAESYVPTLRATVARVAPGVAVAQEQTLRDLVQRLTRADRVAATASGGLALFGLALLAVGFASVFLALVRESRRELAIRVALGATSARLTARIVAQGLVLLAPGATLGVLSAWAVSAELGGLLKGVSPSDPPSYAVAVILATAVGIGALVMAARAATTTEPAETLRME